MKLRVVFALLSLLIHLNAAAQSNSVQLPRLAHQNTPAFEAAKGFLRGANCGNYLEVPPDQNWAVPHDVADLKNMRAEGFDHVRIPVGWHHYTGPAPEFKPTVAIFGKVDHLVTNATALGLNVIINLHHFDQFTTNPGTNTEEFHALWREIAAHYANAPAGVAFELLNEPKDAAKTVVMNPILAETIHEIRRTNPRRTIFVGPGQWNSVNELVNFKLPDDDENLIVTVHCYDPFYFTHQGASWGGPDVKITGIRFPGPPAQPLTPGANVEVPTYVRDWVRRYNTLPTDKNPSAPQAFRAMIQKAKTWSEAQGRPIHFGEFGCFTGADAESRANFYRSFREALNEANMGWAIWDWKAGFKYWDESKGQPMPGMRAALFSK